mmetsp:Transcript_2729/g.7663  ORF Transcript_2729/g.7663 Transcript_2729/m.7663 type:complete len:222 (-) Transcript_2729:160-825(-)
MSRLAPTASRAWCASGGSSELARVEEDSSLSPVPDRVEVDVNGEEMDLVLSAVSAAPSASSALLVSSMASAISALSISRAPTTCSRPSSSRAAGPFFFLRPFFSRPCAAAGGEASAACSSCWRAAHAKSLHSETPTCACARMRRRCASRRSRRSHRSQLRSSRCAVSAVKMCMQAPERERPGGGSSGAQSTSSRTSGSFKGTRSMPRSSAARRCAMTEPSS